MSYASKLGRARISSRNPIHASQCDRCGFVYSSDTMKMQHDWRGATLQNIQLMVCERCYDVPQQQLRAITLPADPVPVRNPRPMQK